MPQEEFALEVGDTLQLQFLPAEGGVRHYVKVIGYLVDKSLIVSTPYHNGKLMLVREGQPVAVRLLSGNDVVAFTVNILRSSSRPYPYLHLSYPTELQTITVRKAQRVHFRCQAKVSLCVQDSTSSSSVREPLTVQLDDMSTTGALIIAPVQLGEIKDILSVSMELNVASGIEHITLVSVIRNIRNRTTSDGQVECLHGVEFQFSDRQESILLHAYVYEKIVSGVKS